MQAVSGSGVQTTASCYAVMRQGGGGEGAAGESKRKKAEEEEEEEEKSGERTDSFPVSSHGGH